MLHPATNCTTLCYNGLLIAPHFATLYYKLHYVVLHCATNCTTFFLQIALSIILHIIRCDGVGDSVACICILVFLCVGVIFRVVGAMACVA